MTNFCDAITGDVKA